eukprot:CAMPEP_0179460096 /NCGR_PEP_ID=MMETSP0799-20121207/43255_1 /TAXON_ID=46947 /ORGANISM="Geminigera cryophila, Strain CCMP2564" /LENGTH=39 /DNA_ID= /DNA_START= /DNA_END= /DNA_ORIENTATION=
MAAFRVVAPAAIATAAVIRSFANAASATDTLSSSRICSS